MFSHLINIIITARRPPLIFRSRICFFYHYIPGAAVSFTCIELDAIILIILIMMVRFIPVVPTWHILW